MGESSPEDVKNPARWRHTAAALTGGLLLGGVLQAPPAQAAAPARASTATQHPGAVLSYASAAGRTAPTRPGTGSETAEIALTSLSPGVPSKDATLTITGTITNRGSSAITGSDVGVRIGAGGRPLGSRSDLAALMKRKAYQPSDGIEVNKHKTPLAEIPPGISVPFTLDVPVKDLNLGRSGVYQLGVSLQGRTKSSSYAQVLGIQRTFLPWYPDPDEAEQTRVTMAWPLIGRAHMGARTDGDDRQTPIFHDDELTSELAPGGRLQQLVALGKDLPVTWVIDPDLLATVDAMANGYRVAEDGTISVGGEQQEASEDSGAAARDTRPGTGSELARQWINELREAVQGSSVVALPFGDPDLASIAHKGRNVPGTLEHLKSATELAAVTTETVLGAEARTDVAWPAEGALDTSIVNVARAGGADKVLASSASLGSGSLQHTPTAVRPIGGGTTALVADEALSHVFEGDLSRAGNATLAVQDFLAQTLVITMESPNRQRSILVAPQRRPTAGAAQSMAKALMAAQEGGWISPVGLETIETAKPEPGADRTVPGPNAYPERLRKQELPSAAFQQIQETKTELDHFVGILSQEERVLVPFTAAMLRSMSDSWRGDPAGAEKYRTAVSAYLAGLKDLVDIVDKSLSTLSGSSGTLQVTVENNLTQQVTLSLHLTSELPYRFRVDAEEQQQTVTIDGERKKTLKFPTTATANGKVSVTAQLYTPEGTPYGEEMTFQVNVTSVTGTVLVVIAFGMVLLVLAGARMYRQRKRAALLTGDEADDAADGSTDQNAEGNATEAAGSAEAGEPGPEPGEAGSVTGGSGNPDRESARDGRADTASAPSTPRPGQPGDPGADTAGESRVPRTADEKVER